MIQSLERAFAILELLDAIPRKDEGLGAQAISDAVGLKFPTAHNIIRTLVELGYIVQDSESKKYKLSAKSRRLGTNKSSKELLVEAGTPVIESLRAEFDETALLSMLVQDCKREVIAESLSTHDLKVSSKLHVPIDDLYRRATGRLMLANMTDDEIDAYWASHGAPSKRDWEEVKTLADLHEQLKKIKKMNVLMLLDVDAIAIAAPVFVPRLGINAALGCGLPASRGSDSIIKAIENALSMRAEELVSILSQK